VSDKDFPKALNYCFLLLRYRQRSKSEIIRRLKVRKYKDQVIRRTVKYLKDYSYIDDRNFAYLYAESYLKKRWGPKRIEAGLKKAGIPLNLRLEVTSQNIDYRGIIAAIVREKQAQYRKRGNIDPANIREKIIRYLLGRGYRYSDILKGLKALSGAENEGI
jgi:regulatory protein